MLRRLLTSVFLLGLLSLTGFARDNESYFGVRLAMDVTFPGGGYDSYNTGAGFTLGGIYNVPFRNNFYFEPGVLFYYTGMSSKDLIKFDNNYLLQGSARQYGFRIPMNVGYQFNAGDNLTVGVATGPMLSVNISARQQLDAVPGAPIPIPDKTVNLFHHGWRNVDLLWGISVNFTFARSYVIGFSTGVGLTPLAKYGNNDKKIRIQRNTVAIALGYNF